MYRTEGEDGEFHNFTTEELVAMILKYAMGLVENHARSSVKDLVIMAPPYIGVAKKRGLLTAADLAGINVLASTISREKFEELCEDMWDKALVPVMEVLKNSGFKADDLYAVELIGGATRVPKLQVLQILVKSASNPTSASSNGTEAGLKSSSEESSDKLEMNDSTSNASISSVTDSATLDIVTEKKLKKRTFRLPLKVPKIARYSGCLYVLRLDLYVPYMLFRKQQGQECLFQKNHLLRLKLESEEFEKISSDLAALYRKTQQDYISIIWYVRCKNGCTPMVKILQPMNFFNVKLLDVGTMNLLQGQLRLTMLEGTSRRCNK
ncbi:heat shock 70 kDa 17-like [Olea europaea subsp. europaea]|uniref:Heat shock 70 kDa 17-like n=1 Tax=Olea europaea subsp. europaea TaxID=158383 RepID=A0A8S0RSP6_OLEEU|nr:heat shock 70 kDa 17-like [Olea europaea subsp. europaea]